MKRNLKENEVSSPTKKFRAPENPDQSTSFTSIKPFNYNSDCWKTPQSQNRYKSALNNTNNGNKKFVISTPKSECKPRYPSVKQKLSKSVDYEAVQRNMSNNWADILEELEEQTKQLDQYIDRVAEKYNLDKEKLKKNLESDAETLRKRQKRINFGKVTAEYERYINALPKKDREPCHPRTPNKYRKCSRRKFDGLIKKWRKLLHIWDENPENLKIEMERDDDLDDSDEKPKNRNEAKGEQNEHGSTSDTISSCELSLIIDDYELMIDEDAI